ncbi:integrase, partial [Sinorhizobium meliloti]|nr:integrase [Sinorhizobium meliloti]MDW9565431.1 integrase [Sinorhizobium meliloti]MDW9652817.1 integrase [Sinorhizobium meliloti]MDW9968421.1 integrase [Sinorhizobium meliloti]MDX0340752.1 integrase [Sinorhizobium meliloti]
MVDNSKTAGSGSQAVVRRAEELDALDAILPFDRRDQLAALLT